MTQTAPTPADFMRMTDGPDFDPADFRPEPLGLHVPPSPSSGPAAVDLTVVLAHLERIEGLIELPKIEKAANEAQQQRIEDLEAEIGELSDLFDGKQALIEQVLEAIKKSTSKLANQVRDILQPEPLAPAPVEPGAEPEGQQPDPEDGKGARIVRAAKPDQAPLSDTNPLPAAPQCSTCLRYFADAQLLEQHDCQGLQEPAADAGVATWRAYGDARGLAGVEHLNRSQIRTMLAIPQPVAPESGDE